MYGLHSVSSHNRHSVTVRVERSIPKFRVLRGAGHFPADRVVFRRADQIPSRHRTHVSVRLHFLQLTAGQVAVCYCGRHHFHVVAVNIHPVYGTRHIKTGSQKIHLAFFCFFILSIYLIVVLNIEKMCAILHPRIQHTYIFLNTSIHYNNNTNNNLV